MSDIGDDDGAAFPADGGVPKVTLAKFRGARDATITRIFIRKVDGYAELCNLNDAATARAVQYVMVDGSPAGLWMDNLFNKEPATANSWVLLRPLVQERFSPQLTASERSSVARALTQGKDENCDDFHDRCKGVQFLADQAAPVALRTGDNAANYRVLSETMALEKFLGGLKETDGFKEAVNGAAGCVNLAQYLEVAQRLERNNLSKKAVTVTLAAVSATTGETADTTENLTKPQAGDSAEVAALRAQFKSSYTGQKKSGGGAGKGGKGGGRGGGAKERADGQSGTRECWTCSSTDHINRNCPDRKKSDGGGNGGGGKKKNGGGGGAQPKAKTWTLAELGSAFQVFNTAAGQSTFGQNQTMAAIESVAPRWAPQPPFAMPFGQDF